MQEQNTVEQISELFGFDHASSSNTWANLSNRGDQQNFLDCTSSSSDGNMTHRHVNQETDSLGNQSLGGSSAGEAMASLDNHDENKMNNEWMLSLSANTSGSSSTEVRRMGVGNVLSLDNVNINLNINQIEENQISRSSDSNEAAPSTGCDTVFTGNSGGVPQTGVSPLYNPFVSEQEEIPSASCFTSTSCGTSSGHGANLPEEIDNRFGSAFGTRRITGKRKNIEGFSGQGQSSGSESSTCSRQTGSFFPHPASGRHISSGSPNISSFSSNLSGANPPEEQLNLGYNTRSREGASEYFLNVQSAESSQRNCRIRMNPGSQADSSVSNLWYVGNSSGQPHAQLLHHPSPLLISLNPSSEARLATPEASSQGQTYVQPVPGLAHLPHPSTINLTSSSQVGSSSNCPLNTRSTEGLTTAIEEANFWRIQRNDVREHSVVAAMRHVTQESTGFSLASGNVSIPSTVASTSRGSSNSGANIPLPPTRVSRQNRSTQHAQIVSDIVHHNFLSSSPDPGGNFNDFLQQNSGLSSSQQELIRQPGVSHRGHQQQLLRSAFLMDRRNDVLGSPMALRMLASAREGRSRMISEHIRNALNLMRRGENIRFESLFYGLADLHDRHRELRLDVDNMSYEELLALEERIGNVNTGLSEETILKHLRQHKYIVFTGNSANEVEPCCICQENYLGDEEIGTLDCGHEFHAACIKKWLTHKNLCPICKMTALVTDK